MESPFSSNVSRGATEKGGFADVTIPLDPARHPVLAALDKRTVARQTAPRGAFPTGPLSTFEVAQGVGLQLAAQAGRKRELPRGFYSGARKASSAAKDVEAVPLNPVAEKIGGTAREVRSIFDLSSLLFGARNLHLDDVSFLRGRQVLKLTVFHDNPDFRTTGVYRIAATD